MDVGLTQAGAAITKTMQDVDTKIAPVTPQKVEQLVEELEAALREAKNTAQEAQAVAVQAAQLLHQGREVVAIGSQVAQAALDLLHRINTGGLTITIAPTVQDNPNVQK